jgi:PAS domain S-box-containing protein
MARQLAIHFPTRLLTIALVLTTVTFAWFGWVIFDARRDVKMFQDESLRIEELRGVIIHLDEVLTMSARMAAATGDPKWEERYRRFEPQLDAAIKETIKIGASSSSIKAATKTDVANIKLVEMENRAFGLVRAGRKEEAQAVLFSPEYETQKQIYAEGITSFASQIRRDFEERVRDDQRIDLLSIIAAMVVGGISFVAWLSAARGVQRWRTTLEQAVSERTQAEQALRRANDELEVRIEQRTAELGKTNQALQAEITERKRTEESLRLLGSALEQCKESILITDGELDWPGPNILFVNSAFTKMTGHTAEEAIGATPQLFEGPRTDKAVLSRLQQSLERGEAFEGEVINYRKDGKELNLELQITPIRSASGRITHSVAIQRDITERKRAVEELRESERRFSDMLRNLELVSIMSDRDARITYCNDHLLRLTGWRREEVIGRD